MGSSRAPARMKQHRLPRMVDVVTTHEVIEETFGPELAGLCACVSRCVQCVQKSMPCMGQERMPGENEKPSSLADSCHHDVVMAVTESRKAPRGANSLSQEDRSKQLRRAAQAMLNLKRHAAL